MGNTDFDKEQNTEVNVLRETNESAESVVEEVNKNEVSDTHEKGVSDTKIKMRVNDLWYYLIFAFQSLYSIFVRISDFSFVIEVSFTETSEMTLKIMKLIAVTSARFLLWTGVYGLVATVFRKHLGSFHFWFTVATCLMTATSIIILLV